jgi:hypothetical protein
VAICVVGGGKILAKMPLGGAISELSTADLCWKSVKNGALDKPLQTNCIDELEIGVILMIR